MLVCPWSVAVSMDTEGIMHVCSFDQTPEIDIPKTFLFLQYLYVTGLHTPVTWNRYLIDIDKISHVLAWGQSMFSSILPEKSVLSGGDPNVLYTYSTCYGSHKS